MLLWCYIIKYKLYFPLSIGIIGVFILVLFSVISRFFCGRYVALSFKEKKAVFAPLFNFQEPPKIEELVLSFLIDCLGHWSIKNNPSVLSARILDLEIYLSDTDKKNAFSGLSNLKKRKDNNLPTTLKKNQK